MADRRVKFSTVIVDHDVQISQRTRRDRVCVGAFAWSEDILRNGYRNAEDILDDFRSVQDVRSFSADIVLCAGAKVRTAGFDGVPSPSEGRKRFSVQLATIAGCPVLFESPDDTHGKRWYLATGRELYTVRTGQYVFDGGDVSQWDDLKVLAELHAGYGTFRITRDQQHVGPALVLLICGEVRILNTTAESGPLFANDHSDIISTPPVFKEDWVLLHPSHHPYWPHAARKAFGLVGEVREKPAQFQRLVDRPIVDDQALPPQAVIHAGIFHKGTDGKDRADADYATLRFWRYDNLSPVTEDDADTSPESVSLGNDLRYEEFEV